MAAVPNDWDIPLISPANPAKDATAPSPHPTLGSTDLACHLSPNDKQDAYPTTRGSPDLPDWLVNSH
jgi:hypothetical protein